MNWKRKLSSRKFWLAVTNFVTMMMAAFNVSEDVKTKVAALIMAGAGLIVYILTEGWTDAAHAKDDKGGDDDGGDSETV